MDEKWEEWYKSASKSLGCCALCHDTGYRKVPRQVKSYVSYYGVPTIEFPQGFETVECFKCKGRTDLRIPVSKIHVGINVILQREFNGLYGAIPAGTYTVIEFDEVNTDIWCMYVNVPYGYGKDYIMAYFGYMPKGIRLVSE